MISAPTSQLTQRRRRIIAAWVVDFV